MESYSSKTTVETKTHPCVLKNTVQEFKSIGCKVMFKWKVIKDLQYITIIKLTSFLTFHLNDVRRLFQVNQKKQYVGLFAKSKSAFKVRDLRYLNESRCRRDSLIHVASVLGILIDDWDIILCHTLVYLLQEAEFRV